MLDDLVGRLVSVSPKDVADVWKWVDEHNQVFSAAYTKFMIQEKKEAIVGHKLRWNNWVSKTFNIFNWRALNNRIPTFDSLIRRNVPVQSSLCRFCSMHEETVDHLFTACGLAMEVWAKVGSWCNIDPVFAFSLGDLMEIPYGLRGDMVSRRRYTQYLWLQLRLF